MSISRKAVTIIEEDCGTTLLKPFSDEYRNHLIVINEDAYGEFTTTMELITEIRKKVNLSDEEFNVILKQLGL